MANKSKGYGKAGRPTAKDIKNLKTAKAIMGNKNLVDAYLETHKKSTRRSARSNAKRMLNKEVMNQVAELLQLEKMAETNRENLEKMLHLVIARYIKGQEQGANYIAAIKLLSQLVPDFKDRHEFDDISKKSESELDDELKKYGIPVTLLREDATDGLSPN